MLPFLVLGNKVDLVGKDSEVGTTGATGQVRRVGTEQAEKFCKENGDMLFFETSAKENINVIDGFKTLASQAVQR